MKCHRRVEIIHVKIIGNCEIAHKEDKTLEQTLEQNRLESADFASVVHMVKDHRKLRLLFHTICHQ